MPDLDDDQFEKYLKKFRPLVPESLPAGELRPARHRARPLLLTAAAVGMAAIVILGVARLRVISRPGSTEPEHSAWVERRGPAHPLTLRDANALLATAPSYKSAMDELVLPRRRSTAPNETQSALTVLAKERIKL